MEELRKELLKELLSKTALKKYYLSHNYVKDEGYYNIQLKESDLIQNKLKHLEEFKCLNEFELFNCPECFECYIKGYGCNTYYCLYCKTVFKYYGNNKYKIPFKYKYLYEKFDNKIMNYYFNEEYY